MSEGGTEDTAYSHAAVRGGFNQRERSSNSRAIRLDTFVDAACSCSAVHAASRCTVWMVTSGFALDDQPTVYTSMVMPDANMRSVRTLNKTLSERQGFGHAIGISATRRGIDGSDGQNRRRCSISVIGEYVWREFGPEASQMGGRNPQANAAVHKAAGRGQPVTQEIAVSVKGNRVECTINGTVVAGYDKSSLVTAGKLQVYRRRLRHPFLA